MNSSLRNQQGAVLIVALVLLLVITLLAVSSTRESALETRMTANFVSQQQQINYAEAVLREGEAQMTTKTFKPREPDCEGDYCFSADDAIYGHVFGSCDTASTSGMESALLPESAYEDSPLDPPQMRWYALPAPTLAAEGMSENPELNPGKVSTARYEITAIARDTDTDTCTILRSTTAKVFN